MLPVKQNLTVKSFVGATENALRIQIWTALIAFLLLKWLHHLSKANWSWSNLASMLRLNLFTYRESAAPTTDAGSRITWTGPGNSDMETSS